MSNYTYSTKEHIEAQRNKKISDMSRRIYLYQEMLYLLHQDALLRPEESRFNGLTEVAIQWHIQLLDNQRKALIVKIYKP